MEKIVLTEFGECLLEYPSTRTSDQDRLRICIGRHEGCGPADFKPISATHKAIHCRDCGLRVVIPKEIDTYGKLRQYLADKLLALAK
jgi:hypothetical protein